MPGISEMMNPKSLNLTALEKRAINAAGRAALLQEIEEMEQRAHRLGLQVTGRALNNAKNALGWEMAGNIDRADKATRGER